MRENPYMRTPQYLHLDTLEQRVLFDLMVLFKIFDGFVQLRVDDLFIFVLGHKKTIVKALGDPLLTQLSKVLFLRKNCICVEKLT